MYSIDTKNVKRGKRFYTMFLVVGLFFVIFISSFLVSNRLKLNSLDSAITSTRVEVESYTNNDDETMYKPIYYYTVDGRDYVCKSSSSSSINPGTANGTVYYDSKNPENCTTEYSKSSNWLVIVAMLIPVLCIVVAIINMRKISKRIAIIKELNQKGKLIKNLPYHLENSGMAVNDVPIRCPVVEYTLPSGSTIILRGDPRHDGKSFDEDGTVDLVIDEDNPENYFIDFEINRLSGNLPTDYYDSPGSNLKG